MVNEVQSLLNKNKFIISHKVEDINNLSENVLLSVNYRKVKELLKFTRHNQFHKFCKDNGLLFRITELQVTNLDFDKSFLDVLKIAFDDELVEEIKKKPSAKILLDEELKISSHLIIVKNTFKNNKQNSYGK